MEKLRDNIQTIRKLAKSRPRLTTMLNKNIPEEFQFTENQIEHYETGRTPPDDIFINRLASLAGVSPQDLKNKELTRGEIKFALKVSDIPTATVRNQIEIIARERVILSILAELMAPVLHLGTDDVLKSYEDLVKETEKQVEEELRRRS